MDHALLPTANPARLCENTGSAEDIASFSPQCLTDPFDRPLCPKGVRLDERRMTRPSLGVWWDDRRYQVTCALADTGRAGGTKEPCAAAPCATAPCEELNLSAGRLFLGRWLGKL